jgi:hypothetical protein
MRGGTYHIYIKFTAGDGNKNIHIYKKKIPIETCTYKNIKILYLSNITTISLFLCLKCHETNSFTSSQSGEKHNNNSKWNR